MPIKTNAARRLAIFVTILAALMLLSGPGCGNQWLLFYNMPINGIVIEDQTGKPLEGVIVVGMWRLSQFLSQGFGGYAKVLEVETDQQGNFRLPWWVTFKPWKFHSAMHNLAPEIIIYKPGYKVYYSHKLEREGFPKDITLTPEQKQATREQYGISPARLKKVYTDEERMKNYKDWGTIARFPDKHFSREQSRIIFNALEQELSNLSAVNPDKHDILIGLKGLRESWAGGK